MFRDQLTGIQVVVICCGADGFLRDQAEPAGAHPPARDVEGKDQTETFTQLNAVMAESVVLRSRDEVAGLFGELETVEPGVVQLPEWRPDPGTAPAGPLPCGAEQRARRRPRWTVSSAVAPCTGSWCGRCSTAPCPCRGRRRGRRGSA